MWIQDHFIEIFGAITGILFVFLEIRQNIWLWPLGLITSATYIWVFYDSGLYADMGLQWYYLVISAYGWYWWRRGGDNISKKELNISRIRNGLTLKLSLITLGIFILIWFVLDRFTDSIIPGWDAFTTAVSITATWMLARKIIEHWILWVIIDVISMGLYLYRGLYPTLFLFAIYTIMAVIGYRQWKMTLNNTAGT